MFGKTFILKGEFGGGKIELNVEDTTIAEQIFCFFRLRTINQAQTYLIQMGAGIGIAANRGAE